MDSVGEGGGGKIWENGIETCEMSCMKRDASPGSMQKKKKEMNRQSRFDAGYRMLGAGALG